MEETGKPMRGRFGKKAAKKAPAKKTAAKRAPAKKAAKKTAKKATKKVAKKKTAAKKAPAKKPASKTVDDDRSEEHTSELQSLMRNSYAVFCSKKKNKKHKTQ